MTDNQTNKRVMSNMCQQKMS